MNTGRWINFFAINSLFLSIYRNKNYFFHHNFLFKKKSLGKRINTSINDLDERLRRTGRGVLVTNDNGYTVDNIPVKKVDLSRNMGYDTYQNQSMYIEERNQYSPNPNNSSYGPRFEGSARSTQNNRSISPLSKSRNTK